MTRLPKYLLDAVKDNKPRELETIALIQAIEPAESAVCNRLDAEGLVVLCCAFLIAPSCSAQRRGFYLIMVDCPNLAKATWMLTLDRHRCITINRTHLTRQP